ncbi:MAG TPA: J domain-containing protein [Allosphingosinicella sp.]|jgi:curved DNA-binding protein CbpA
MTDRRDAYDELGVAPSAEQEVIEAAYLALIKKYHPDHHDGATADAANERAQRLNAAWAEIGTPQRRRDYDGRRALAGRPEPRTAEKARPARAESPSRRRGARVSIARYFGRGRDDGAGRGIGPGAIALVALTLLLLGLWMADIRRYWDDPVPPPAVRR